LAEAVDMSAPGEGSGGTGAAARREQRRAAAERKDQVAERFARFVNRGQMSYLRSGHLDVLESSREGIGFVDAGSGRPYIDCFTSAGCFNVGRRNPVVLAALEAALDDGLDMGTTLFISPARVELAERLAALAPGDLSRVIFAGGGGDAIDCAIRLARAATGRGAVVAMDKAYHGHTGLALSANGKAHYREFFEPLAPGFSFVPFNDLVAAEAAVTAETAAVILEPVQGEAGIFVATDEYLLGLRALCDEFGALLIFDEIQTGFGRTGKLFAAEHSGVVPDIMTLAKSLAGSLYPNAAVLYRDTKALVGAVESEPWFHTTTTGGSDIGCRVSLAVLDELVENRLWENAAARGRELKSALEALRVENPRIIREVRGRGLMLGVEYVHEFMGPLMSDALSKQGVFAAYSGNAPQVMRFMLPLTVSEREMQDVIAAIRAAVYSVRWLMPLALPAAKLPGVLPLLNDEMVQIRLFGLLRTVEDMGDEAKERVGSVTGRVNGETGKDLVRRIEPQLQRLVAAMLRAGAAADQKLGPVVRPACGKVREAAGQTAGQAAGAVGGAGRKVAEKLPAPVQRAGRSAVAATARTPQAVKRAVPAATDAVRKAPQAVQRAVPAARDALTGVASTTAGAARKAAEAAGSAAARAKDTLPHDREELRDPDSWGRAAGALGGKVMDGLATGVDAAARGARTAAAGPAAVRRMVTGQEPKGPEEQ
jgi:putrescine aminotransferase